MSASVEITNTPPTIDSVSISPDPAVMSDILTCAYEGFYDDNGDADQSSMVWSVNGAEVGSDETLEGVFVGGDLVTCDVTPYDGIDEGTVVTASITIGNTAPELADVELSPAPAAEGDTFTCTPGSTTDVDADLCHSD